MRDKETLHRSVFGPGSPLFYYRRYSEATSTVVLPTTVSPMSASIL